MNFFSLPSRCLRRAAETRVPRLLSLALPLLLTSKFLPATAAPSSAVREALDALRSVGPQGAGTAAAQPAWKRLAAASPEVLPDLLAAMDGANDYSLNWLRAAADAISGAPGITLPVAEFRQFLDQTGHHPRARRLAYELIRRGDPTLAQRLLPSFVNDTSNELRRDAVQEILTQGEAALAAGKKAEGVESLRRALNHARDVDQIDQLAKRLRELGQTVDLPKTFGWLTHWRLIGPFDNTGGAGFDKVFPPEKGVDLQAEYDGKSGKVRWQEYTTQHDYGMVDFNKPFTQLKEVTGYAFTEFESDTARPVEVRLGCKNGWKVWLNGQLLFGRDEYHRGAEIDQYRLAAQLRPGRNTLLVKCTQNEQKEEWTVEWEFQLRLTDALGTPIKLGGQP